MAEYSRVSERLQKSPKGRGWKSTLKMLLITGAVVFITIYLFWGEYGLFRMWYLEHRIERLEKDIKILQVQRNDILWETDKMQNDPQYIQRYAIETYGYARPDQKIIQFVSVGSDSSLIGSVAPQNGRPLNGPIQNRSIRHTR